MQNVNSYLELSEILRTVFTFPVHKTFSWSILVLYSSELDPDPAYIWPRFEKLMNLFKFFLLEDKRLQSYWRQFGPPPPWAHHFHFSWRIWQFLEIKYFFCLLTFQFHPIKIVWNVKYNLNIFPLVKVQNTILEDGHVLHLCVGLVILYNRIKDGLTLVGISKN